MNNLYLIQSKNRVLDRNFALEKICGEQGYFTARSMDVYITKLRKHLKEDTNLEIVNILLAAGCNPFNANKEGLNALTVAEKKNFPDCVKAIKDFMDENSHLENKVTVTENTADVAVDEQEEMQGIVSLLKKLNPFSR